jgi:hypothetical protein
MAIHMMVILKMEKEPERVGFVGTMVIHIVAIS